MEDDPAGIGDNWRSFTGRKKGASQTEENAENRKKEHWTRSLELDPAKETGGEKIFEGKNKRVTH